MRGQKQTPVAVEPSNHSGEDGSKTGAERCDTIISQRKGNTMAGQPNDLQNHPDAESLLRNLDHTKGDLEP